METKMELPLELLTQLEMSQDLHHQEMPSLEREMRTELIQLKSKPTNKRDKRDQLDNNQLLLNQPLSHNKQKLQFKPTKRMLLLQEDNIKNRDHLSQLLKRLQRNQTKPTQPLKEI